MCGQALVLTRKYDKDVIDIGLKLGLINILRGVDSGGVYIANTTTGVNKTVRTLGILSDVYSMKRFRQALDDIEPNLMMLHARASTIGASDLLNCQPITKSGVTLLHNGTITGIADTVAKTSDSHAIADIVNSVDFNPADMYHDVLSKGAAALMWHDLSNNTVGLLRNDKRSLAVAGNFADHALFVSSDPKHLDIVLDSCTGSYRNAVKIPTGVLIEVDCNDEFKVRSTSLESPEVPVRQLKKSYYRSPKVNNNRHYSSGNRGGGKEWHNKSKPSSGVAPQYQGYDNYSEWLFEEATEGLEDKGISDPGGSAYDRVYSKAGASAGSKGINMYSGPREEVINKGRASQLLDQGCSCCGKVETVYRNVRFIRRTDKYVCEECYMTQVYFQKYHKKTPVFVGGMIMADGKLRDTFSVRQSRTLARITNNKGKVSSSAPGHQGGKVVNIDVSKNRSTKGKGEKK